ncbi:thiol:disulfide interchange protein DsbG [Pseudomonas sp. RP23018S]|uniref:thiol:disulfide interchange protein DsbG n=1 Tax=Pseudomonas sp. RP23018S TaxID=3096037 RepID=UPI002ACA11E8|nr:thiol:disulfide interchange protein DsbG [Pseudomonas sp. RP23018S]MDZ5602340.1 thiol:disulfide interchange protein DsbG [Pseudomonas sp. RP23018S]
MRLTLPLTFALLGIPLVQAEELPAPIQQIQAKGAVIKGRFDAPDGLRGYAAEYQNNALALYLTADGKHVLVGNLFDAKGQDLSAEPLDKLVYEPMNKAIWTQLEKTTWIADGNADAPRTLYVFSDPNCPYCNLFWEQARPWVESGKVQLRHIMVGIIRADSLAKSAALLAAQDPAKALHTHEAAGKGSDLKPLAQIPAAIEQQLAGNMTLLKELGLQATPAIFFLDEHGRMQRQQGAPRPEMLEALLGKR